MTKKKRAEKIDEAIRLVWDSMQSHLQWTHQVTSEGEKFHQKCVAEYADLMKILSDLY